MLTFFTSLLCFVSIFPLAYSAPLNLFARLAQHGSGGHGHSTSTAASTVTTTSQAKQSTTTSAAGVTTSATVSAYTSTTTATSSAAAVSTGGTGALSVKVVNKLSSGTLKAWIKGNVVSGSGSQAVMVTSQGFYTPSDGEDLTSKSVTISGSSTTITIPGYLSSARIFLAVNGDLDFSYTSSGGIAEPALTTDVSFGFAELSSSAAGGLNFNLATVDFLGLPIGLSATNGASTVSAPGPTSNAVQEICDALKTQAASDGQPWDELCYTPSGASSPLRVLSPTHSTTSFTGYYEPYIDSVWTKYATSPLTINMGDTPTYSCTTGTSSTAMTCTGAGSVKADISHTFTKPSTNDIWGCVTAAFENSGTTDDENIAARLCAAFHRSTLLVETSTPAGSLVNYYKTNPTNWYAKLVHANAPDGRGYAFPYDDVHALGNDPTLGYPADEQAGAMQIDDATELTVTVGG